MIIDNFFNWVVIIFCVFGMGACMPHRSPSVLSGGNAVVPADTPLPENPFEETDKTFFYEGEPIHPLVIKEFIPWVSDDWKSKIISIDIAATHGTNQFYKKFFWEKRGDRVYCSIDDEEHSDWKPAFFVYEWLGRLNNGIQVVFTCECTGGSGEFMNLLFLKISQGSAFTPEGEVYSQLLLTVVRNIALGDRYDGDIKLISNGVRIGESRYNKNPVLITF